MNKKFVLTFLAILLMNIISYPSLSYNAEIYAETGTNYLFYAQEAGFLENIRQTDSGYLVILPRMIALAIYHTFGINPYLPYIFQGVSLIFIALFSSFLVLKIYSPIIRSDSLRIILALCVGLYPNYSLRAFINFVYFAFPALILLLFLSFKGFSVKKLIMITALSAACVMSKAYFVVLLPILLFWMLIAIKNKDKLKIIFSMIVCSALLIQASVLFSSSQNYASKPSVDLFNFALNWLPYLFHIFALFSIPKTIFNDLTFFISLVINLWFLVKIIQNRNRFLLLVFLSLWAFAGGWLAMNYLSTASGIVLSIKTSYFDVPGRVMSQQFLGLEFGAFIMLFLIAQTFNRKFVSYVFLSLFLIEAVKPFSLKHDENPPYKSFGNWRAYHSLMKNERYFIPINPYPWAIKKNSKVVYNEAKSENLPLQFTMPTTINGVIYKASSPECEYKVSNQSSHHFSTATHYWSYTILKRASTKIRFENESNTNCKLIHVIAIQFTD